MELWLEIDRQALLRPGIDILVRQATRNLWSCRGLWADGPLAPTPVVKRETFEVEKVDGPVVVLGMSCK
jgi:hypothetical protein